MNNYLTPAQICALFAWGRDQLSKTARREAWPRQRVNNGWVYDAAVVVNFALSRPRRKVEFTTGPCPKCDSRAVFSSTGAWCCAGGHYGEEDNR
jgi:nicotinamide riboside transporter PnuC